MRVKIKTQGSQIEHTVDAIRRLSFDPSLLSCDDYCCIDSLGENRDEMVSQCSDILNITREQIKKVQQERNFYLTNFENSQRFRKQLQLQMQYNLDENRRLRHSNQQLQQGRISQINRISELMEKVSKYEGMIGVNDQKIYNKERQINKLIDQLNFERQMSVDLRKQNIEIKCYLKNIESNLEGVLKDNNIAETLRKLKDEFESIGGSLKNEVNRLRGQIKQIEGKENCSIQHQSQLFKEFTRISEKYNEIINQMKKLKQQALINYDQQQSKENYVEIINTQETKIRDLSLKVSTLTQKACLNSDLSEFHNNNKQNTYFTALSPKSHTNSSYVTKLIRENHQQIKQLKKINEERGQQIERLRESLKLFLNQEQKKNEEISRLTILLKSQAKQQQDQENTNKNKKQSLNRKIEELTEAIKSQKKEIAEKDRIIMVYVANRKNANI